MANALGTLFQDIADAIRGKTGQAGAMKPSEFPEKISEIDTTSVDVSLNTLIDSINGEIINGVSVTFVGYGGEVLFETTVAPGNDCPDPVLLKYITKPTKESSVAEHFTFSGWSLADGGEADDAALWDVTEPRTVYAAFTASVRYYTVRFFDGETLLRSEQVAYGGSSTYTYEKTGARFTGWEPAAENITGDTDCYGSWNFDPFAADSWETIVETAKAGTASQYYSVGDVREIEIGGETIILQIAGFNKDTDSSGNKCNITIISKNPLKDSYMAYDTTPASDSGGTYYNDGGFLNSDVNTYLENTVFPALPSVLRRNIKFSQKKYTASLGQYGNTTSETIFTLWIPAHTEVDDTLKYDVYKTKENRIATLYDTGEAVRWWTRTGYDQSLYCIEPDGSRSVVVNANQGKAYVIFGFCL